MYKYTLQMKIYLIDIASGEKELVETKMTSPTAFFDHFPVHRSKMTWSVEKTHLTVTEVDVNKFKVYQAEVTNTIGNYLQILLGNLSSDLNIRKDQ